MPVHAKRTASIVIDAPAEAVCDVALHEQAAPARNVVCFFDDRWAAGVTVFDLAAGDVSAKPPDAKSADAATSCPALGGAPG